MICFLSHASSKCPDRTQQHCPDCHVYVQHCTDHAAICSQKTWLNKKYGSLYAHSPMERCIISIDCPFRFLKDGCWRKGNDGLEMYSPGTGAFFQYKSEHDLSLLSNGFVSVRVVLVIKDDNKFFEKVVLMTSKKQMIVATRCDKEFTQKVGNVNAIDPYTTLVLAMSAENNPTVQINLFPKDKVHRQYVLRYDKFTKTFDVPTGLNVGSTSTGLFGDDAAPIHTELDIQSSQSSANIGDHRLVEFNPMRIRQTQPQNSSRVNNTNNTNANCIACYGAHHSPDCCQRILSNCFECHVPAKYVADHAQSCSVKQWFTSEKIDRYVKIPCVRCVVSFESAVQIVMNENFEMPQSGLRLFSAMSDTFYKFESNKKVVLLTTGYTRIRLPVIMEDSSGIFMEKLVLLTSIDRSIVAVKGSRPVTKFTMLDGYEHNTSLVLCADNKKANFSVEVHGGSQRVLKYEIIYNQATKKYIVSDQLDAKSKQYSLMAFDAPVPKKKK